MKKLKLHTKVEKYKRNQNKFYYVSCRRNKKIAKDTFVIESTHGNSVGGQLYYLIENIISNKPKANIYFVSRNVQNSKNIFKYRNKPNINFVNHLSKEYYELLA